MRWTKKISPGVSPELAEGVEMGHDCPFAAPSTWLRACFACLREIYSEIRLRLCHAGSLRGIHYARQYGQLDRSETQDAALRKSQRRQGARVRNDIVSSIQRAGPCALHRALESPRSCRGAVVRGAAARFEINRRGAGSASGRPALRCAF